MASIEQLEPRIHYRDQMFVAQENILRRPFFSAIRWGAVIAGLTVGLAVQLVLALLGIAAGLTELDAASGYRMGYVSSIWGGLSMLMSTFVGGYVAARLSGLRRKTDGALHGAVSWAISTLLFAALATSAGGALLSGVFTSMSPEVAGSAQSSDAGLTALMRGQLGGNISVADLQTLQRYIQAGQREEAVLLLSSMGMDPIRATTIVDQVMLVASNPDQASSQGSAAADRSIGVAGTLVWVAFFGVFLSLLLGMTGGVVGAMGGRRIVWKKEDAPVPRRGSGPVST